MLTLKQLADKISKEFNLSISKQAVQYHGDKLEIEYHYNNGVKYLDDEQQQLITNRIKEVHLANVESDTSTNTNVEDREDTNKNTQSNNYNIDPIAILQSHITLLSSQLDKKDNQLDKAQELIDQQQRLAIDQSNKVRELEKELKVYKQLEYNKEVQQQEVATNTKQDVEDAEVKEDSSTSDIEDVQENVQEDNVKENTHKRTWLDKLLGR